MFLDPGRALCWEDESTIRIGFERGDVLVSSPTPQAQQVITRLISGIPEDEFAGLMRHSRSDEDGVREMLEAVRPALVRGYVSTTNPGRVIGSGPIEHVRSSIRTAMHDDGREIPELRTALESSWLCSFVRSSASPELVVQVLRFLEPLERTGRWLSSGIPHLLVRFTDETVRIGPLVSANGAPCHTCEALHLADADPALPSLVAQFTGKHPSSETAQVALIVGSIAAHYVHAWRNGAVWVHDAQLRIPVQRGIVSGLPSLERITTHRECGCAITEAPLPP